MPTIARIGPYRVYFYSYDVKEPPHVHVDRDDCTAKVWLQPIELAYNIGFRSKELRAVIRLVEERADEFLEAWHDNFDA